MKYTTFRALVIGGAVTLGGGGIYLATRGGGDEAASATPNVPRPEPSRGPSLAPSPSPLGGPVPSPASGAGVALRPMDTEVLARMQQPISGDKAKDAIPGKAYKANLYRDAGKPGVNRVKIDLDRDDKWDEKWSLEDDGSIKRQVSTIDDDKTYDQEFTLRGDRWLGAADLAAAAAAAAAPAPSAPPSPTPAPSPAAGDDTAALRPMDEAILRRAAEPATSDKIKDAFPGQPYKVNLYHDAGTAGWNRAKVDLDRDDKDDEKWTFEGQGAEMTVKRQVSPADDGTYPVEYRLRAGQWALKK